MTRQPGFTESPLFSDVWRSVCKVVARANTYPFLTRVPGRSWHRLRKQKLYFKLILSNFPPTMFTSGRRRRCRQSSRKLVAPPALMFLFSFWASPEQARKSWRDLFMTVRHGVADRS